MANKLEIAPSQDLRRALSPFRVSFPYKVKKSDSFGCVWSIHLEDRFREFQFANRENSDVSENPSDCTRFASK